MCIALGPCKAGYYCNPNSSKELPCKEGTYSNITGLFDKSGCKTCPLDAYCPSGSTLPIPCPSSNFFPARRTKIKISHGKRNGDECRLCPVDPCDSVGECVDVLQFNLTIVYFEPCYLSEPIYFRANSFVIYFQKLGSCIVAYYIFCFIEELEMIVQLIYCGYLHTLGNILFVYFSLYKL